MTSCTNPLVEDFCPTQAELAPQLIAMLPRGRAWGEGGPAREPGGILYQFWWAVAGVFAFLHAQICALALEFTCATASLTLDLWFQEYGLPDGCDPYPNLCAKVAALGGVTCVYYQSVAAALGWAIACGANCALDVGCMEAGMAVGVAAGPGTLMIIVYLEQSPAFTGSAQVMGPVMGFLEAGMAPACGPDITALDCVIQRIAPAHADISYTLVS